VIRPDETVRLGASWIQHGIYNNRVYLMKLAAGEAGDVAAKLDRLAARRGYGKIFAKIPAASAGPFLQRGYAREAVVPGFYGKGRDGWFLAKYFDPDRSQLSRADRSQIKKILALARAPASPDASPLPEGYVLSPARAEDADDLARLYRDVFPTYPFPIRDPAYLVRAMATHADYVLVRRRRRVVAAASAERDDDYGHAELTDFATRPRHRGRGLATHLLRLMEERARRRGLRLGYTIARALSPGVNRLFASAGYRFAGTLLNNTNIAGRIESMNVWYKLLGRA